MDFKEQSLSLTLVLASGACLALWFRGADSDSNFLQQAEESDGKPQEFHPEALVNYESLRMGIRESIGPAILVEEPAAIPEETFRAALLLQRWPDHAPLAEVRVNFFGDPGPAWTKAVTTKKGHLELPEELATATCLLRVRAEGFEPQEVELHVSDGLVRLQVVSLVPTHGYLGRVLSPENSPLAGRKVEGWWIEAPRPYEGARHERVSRAATLTGSAAGRPDKLSEATRDLDDVDDLDPFSLAPTLAAELEAMLSGPAFLCARDTLAATTLTNAEGWFYVEALGGAVTGQLTLYCQDEAGSNMRMRSCPGADAHSRVFSYPKALSRPSPRRPPMIRLSPPSLLLLLPVLLCTGSCGGEPEQPRPKNVLLIVVDTLRSDRLGCYGYDRATSPEIDRLAKGGTLYENCYAQACWTIPSMISMMTGVFVTEAESALPKQLIVLGEALRARGLETAAFPANPTLCLDRGFERGFDHFIPIKGRSGEAIPPAFDEWLTAKLADPERKDKGFFVWAQFMAPHKPYKPREEHDLFTDQLPEQAQLTKFWQIERPRATKLVAGAQGKSLKFRGAVKKMHRMINRYDGEVHQADAGVRAIIARLETAGELANTLIIISSDHGEMLFEHTNEELLIQSRLKTEGTLPDGVMDLFTSGHRAWYYDDLWNTPLILYGPGIPAGVRHKGLAANLDIFPTILEALDLPLIPGLQGQSLFTGRDAVRERIFAYGHRSTAVREADGTKFFTSPRAMHMLEGEGADPAVLYDLPSDPDERQDLSAKRPEEVRRLRALLAEWHVLNKRETTNKTTAAQRKILEEMGYVGEGLDFDSDELDSDER